MEQEARNPVLLYLEPLAGEWETEATHPCLPDAVIRGRTTFEWLEGGRFFIWRSHHDHPDIPDTIAILGCGNPEDDASSDWEGGCLMHYFDSRGVSRMYGLDAQERVWRFWRDQPNFSQRAVCTVSTDGNTMIQDGELSRDGTTWEQDLRVAYRRVGRG